MNSSYKSLPITNYMKRFTLITVLILLTSAAIFAQSGYGDIVVHLKNGSTIEGLFKPNRNRPWRDQSRIKVYPKSLGRKNKIKKSQKIKFKAKEIAAYEYENCFLKREKYLSKN